MRQEAGMRQEARIEERAEIQGEFEQLSAVERKEILRICQGGRRRLDETPDERQEAARLRATLHSDFFEQRSFGLPQLTGPGGCGCLLAGGGTC